MKRWCLSGCVFLAVVAALLLSVAAGAQDTCEEADALYNVKLYDEAQKAYIELLKNNTHLTYAQSGINKSRQKKAEEFYNLGEEYRKARQYDLAYAEYKKALEINQTLACAQSRINESRQKKAEEFYRLGIAYEKAKEYKSARDAYINALGIDPTFNKSYEALNQVSNRLFTEVRTLAGMGLYAEAGERLKKVVEENPGIDVPEDLKYLLGEKIFFWRRPWWIYPLGEVLVLGVIGALFVWLFYLWTGSRKPRLDIQDFDKGATNLDIGKGLAAMVEVSFKQIGESGAHGSRPSLIEGTIEKFEIPADVKSLHPYTKIVSALFEWLFRPNVCLLSGYLQKPEDALGAGLTLSLVRKKKGEIIANETIWQKDFDPAITPSEVNGPAPYYRLAEPAAIWTLFQEESVRDKLSWLPCIKRGFTFNSSNKKFALLGTSDWLSFAYFRAGVRWAREERDDKARKLYVEALNQDTDNRGAWFNLGALDTEDGKYKRAIKRLERARKKYLFCWDIISESDKRRLRRFLVDDLGIRWAENAEIYKSDGKTICICKDNDKTICGNDKLLKYSAKITLNEKEDEEKATLKINDVDPLILKVITEEKEKGKKKTKIFYESKPKDPVWYKATYQLAATYHYCSMQQQAEDEAENLVATIQEAIKALQKSEDKALRNFLKSFEPMAAIMYAAILADNNEKEKEKEEARGIVENIDTSKLTYRSHYNMACYYSETKDDEKAWEHLEYALERGGDIVQWAKNDPSLKRLREDTEGEFDKLIEKYFAPVMPSADLLPLAGLRLIGETYAKQLEGQGIVSYNDLILKADTPEVRKKLAKKLGIDDMFLQRWALLADMMRIEGIDTQYANLLDAAGVRSLDDLKHIPNIDTLVDSLCKLNAQFLVKQLLSVEIVKQWKEDAEIIAPKVLV